MKELIKKILQEEIQKRFKKSGPSKEKFIIQYMEKLLSETKRIVVPPEENYGNQSEEWCKGGKAIVTSRYYFNDDESDEEKFYSGSLLVDIEVINLLCRMLQVRKSYVLNVITEWYDEKYTTKFGQEIGHPEIEIDETNDIESPRNCYEMVDTSNLSREYMIDYLDTNTLYKLSELEELPDGELSRRYRSVYNIQLNKD
jgi:hypothetical protein